MNVLIVSHKPPFPPNDGGCLAIYNLALGLNKKNVNVDVFSIETHKHKFNVENRDKIPFNIEAHFVDTKLKATKAISALLKNESYNISRFYDKTFEKKLIQKISDNAYDIIQLETLFVTPYISAIKRHSTAKIIYRSHNVEYKIWEHLATGEKRTLKKSYLKKLATQLKKYEYSTLNRYDGAVFITNEDKDYYNKGGCKRPHLTIPFSVDESLYKPSLNKLNSISYLGSMDWLPNTQGVDWFINNVWKSIEATSAIQFHLAGKNMPNKYYKFDSKQFKTIGEVNNAIAFINAHNIMIVPLFSGSGMRVKIIEAMALGKIVIGTSLAFEGIENVRHNENVLIANDAIEFSEAITTTITDKNLVNKLSKNARLLIEEKYSIDANTDKLIAFYKNLMNES
jgi:glycosyltransferase involved in cell wall biosynthesis